MTVIFLSNFVLKIDIIHHCMVSVCVCLIWVCHLVPGDLPGQYQQPVI